MVRRLRPCSSPMSFAIAAIAATLLTALPASCDAGAKPMRVAGMLPGKPMMWQDRGSLSPSMVYWGQASLHKHPESRLPAPPFGDFKKEYTPYAYSPKCQCADSQGHKWTVKFSHEVHSEIAATRLEWALGYPADEDYYVASGRIRGVGVDTDRGYAAGYVGVGGYFKNARFKRHAGVHPQDEMGSDLTWNEAKNPGVPREQLSGLLILDVMTHNWDAQPKNCKMLHVDAPGGAENWYYMSDFGATFGGGHDIWNLKGYQKETSFVKDVSDDTVGLRFYDVIPAQQKLHEQIPLADAQWFRSDLQKLTEDDIIAAFNAAVATKALDDAYTSGDMAKVKQLTTPEVLGFAMQFKAKVDEFVAKVPPAPAQQ